MPRINALSANSCLIAGYPLICEGLDFFLQSQYGHEPPAAVTAKEAPLMVTATNRQRW
ncbi:MAG: hypothetical protein JNK77_10035 [Saprospiraceae bacterium]|nr:hypothetical protein [Saprospiraceae bacterium]